MAKINFGGVVEEVITRKEFPLSKAKKILQKDVQLWNKIKLKMSFGIIPWVPSVSIIKI